MMIYVGEGVTYSEDCVRKILLEALESLKPILEMDCEVLAKQMAPLVRERLNQLIHIDIPVPKGKDSK